jgi:transposase
METLQTIAAGYGRRLDVVDLGGRRRFSDDFKLAVVAESYAAGAVITQIARRYGVDPSQIYVWRVQARGDGGGVGRISEPPAFVPVVATG